MDSTEKGGNKGQQRQGQRQCLCIPCMRVDSHYPYLIITSQMDKKQLETTIVGLQQRMAQFEAHMEALGSRNKDLKVRDSSTEKGKNKRESER